MLNVCVYFSPWSRTISPTGVGRHAIEMTRHLDQRDDVNASVFTPSNQEMSEESFPKELSTLSMYRIPMSDNLSRLFFIGARWQGIDRWAKGTNWVYCPKEQPVATSKAHLAVNVHDILTFETGINGLNGSGSSRVRLRWAHAMKHIGRAELVTTVSEFTKTRLVDLFKIDPGRIVVTGNGVSDVFFRSRKDSDEEVLKHFGVESGSYFLSVGSLTRRKGGDLLLTAAERLKNAGYQTPVLVTGRRHDADLFADYQTAGERDPSQLVRLVGYVQDEDQAALLTHAKALVFPSRYEGFGIPALEAMAAGTVVIGAKAAALPEVIGAAGRFIDPDNVDQLTDEMISILEDQIDRQSLIEQGNRRAEEFRWGQCVDRLVKAMIDRS
ncbi:MAG: glycosyltransferase family 1 protein [Planctomycetaceae bacterium]